MEFLEQFFVGGVTECEAWEDPWSQMSKIIRNEESKDDSQNTALVTISISSHYTRMLQLIHASTNVP